jgi:hypothetical protein
LQDGSQYFFGNEKQILKTKKESIVDLWHLIFMSFYTPEFLSGFFIANSGYLQYG